MPVVVRGSCLTKPMAIAVAMAVAALSGAPSPTSAQGLLQSLFGFGGSQPPRLPPNAYFPQRPTVPFASPYSSRSGAGSGFDREGGGGSYRTICVRMCDGYYWPISHGVSRSRFGRDAQACRSSCGSDARLFYAPGNGSAQDMVDLTGRAYSQIPNAFRYSKALSSSCGCKPAPWSDTELARHQRYAAEASQAATVAAAGGNDRSPVGMLAGTEYSAKAAPASPAPLTSVVVVDAAASAVQGSVVTPMMPGTPSSHSVQKVEALPAPAAQKQAVAMPRPRAPAQAPFGLTTTPSPRPRVAAPTRAAGAPLGSRPSTRMGMGGPPPPVVKSSKPPATARAPVYSHELGRFVFPGDNRYR